MLITMKLSLLLLVGTVTAFQNKNGIRIRSSLLFSTKSARSNFFADDFTLLQLEKLQEAAKPRRYNDLDEISQLITSDVSRADNYYEGTLQKTRKNRLASTESNDLQKRVEIDANYFKLMNAGYERRLVSQQENVAREFTHLTVLSQAAARTSNSMELGKSKDEQLKELKKKKIEQRSGIYQMIPQKFHKYLDYLNSLKKSPTPAQIRQNLGLGAIFTFIVLTQSRKVMFYIIGTLGIMSSLLTRNMPQPKNLPGMPAGANRKVVNWSQSAFKTALAITMFYTLSSGLIAAGVVNLLNLPSKIRLIMATTLASSAYFTLFYEVFEEKSKPGWRWKQAMEGLLPEAMEKELKDQVFSKSSTKMQDEYDFEYDPQVDEYPRQPKYLDELDAEDTMTAGGSGELDENESKEHFDSWKQSRKEARRPAIEDVAPETPWVGGKAGLFVENAPKWLATAYQKNVLKANAWRGRPSKYVKDNSEFEAITGPVGFRDKRPEWLDLFGSGVWEEKVTASRRAARAFGTYRKTMYKLDDKVELQPCDGADK